MIRIEAIRAVIHTNSGKFGRTLKFEKGLNIVRADNTSGKSSLFGAILYGLGFEEILGSRNDKALQSVFKSVVKEIIGNAEIEHSVVQSEIYLQLTNGEKSITTKRFIVNDNIKPQAVEVFWGPLLTEHNSNIVRQAMYVHDAGAANNQEIGFHKFLEEYIGAKLPEIINQDGKRVKMYLPLIATAHFIEQKAGWSDFYANMPYYGIRDAAAKVFEYILNLDVFEIAAKRQENQNKLRAISDQWTELHVKIYSLAKRGGSEAVGIPTSPQILSLETKPYLRFLRGDKSLLLSELLNKLTDDLNVVLAQIQVPVSENISGIEDELNNMKTHTERYEILYEDLSSQVSQDKERLRQYSSQSKNIDEDLRKNKDAEKVQSIGLESNFKVSNNLCPTCNQDIDGTLLNERLQVMPMRIDENISYLQAQRKMVSAFIDNIREQIREKENRVSALENAINSNRQRIRALKRTLVSDDRLPSQEIIESKVSLEREISFLYRLREDFDQLIGQLYELGNEYHSAKGVGVSSPSGYLSLKDKDKISQFENKFRSYLQKFGFTSKPLNTMHVSLEKYVPMYELLLPNGLTKQVDIRFESSASDYIRAQWAYYTTLMKTSIENVGNHFQLIMFDEPQQQSAGNDNFKEFLRELEKFKDQQIIVFASFNNSEEYYTETTEELSDYNIIDFVKTKQMFIQREE